MRTPGDTAAGVCEAAFRHGLLMETSGARGDVVKMLPPLTISDGEIDEFLEIFEKSLRAVLAP